jgi:hypothetical protein
VTGEDAVARALASVERRFVRHQARINHILGMGGGAVRVRGGAEGGPGAVIRQARQLQQNQQRAVRLTREQQVAVKHLAAEQKASHRYELAAHREKLKAVEREKRAEIRKIQEVRRASLRERENLNKSFRSAALGGGNKAIGGLASVGRTGAAMLGVGGSVLAASAVTESLKLDEQIRRFSVAGRAPGTGGLDPEAVRKQVMGIAMSRGIAPEAVLSGAQQFQTITGKGDMGLKMADTFATFAQATGGDPAEIAAAAASLFQNLKIEDIDALTESLAKLTFQGKAGSFEFSAMADQLPRITAALGGRGIGGGTGGVAKMGAALQVIQRGTGDAAVTSTAFDAVLRQLIAKAGDIQDGSAFASGKKVNVFEGGDATGAMRGDFDTLIADVLKASGGNSITLQKMFGDEGMKGINPFVAAFKGAGGGDAGHAAVLKLFKEFEDVGGNYTEIQRDAADVQKSTSIEFEIAMMELKEVFATELVPVVRDLVPYLREMAPVVRTVTEYAVALGQALADNPLKGLGAALAFAIGAEITKAQLASVLQGGVITPLGAVGMAAGATAAALMSFAAYVERKTNEGKAKASEAAARGNEVRAKAQAELDANGALSPETEKQLKDLQMTEKGTIAAGNQAVAESGGARDWFETGMASLGHDGYEAALEKRKALQGAVTSKDYMDGSGETDRLLEINNMSKKYGPEAFKAQEVGAAIGDAVVAKINSSTLNRADVPSKPVVK